MRCSFLVLVLFCLPCPAQSKRGMPAADRDKAVKEKVDARTLVEALANHNRRPKHVGKHHDPIFDAGFDWKEDERTWRALRSLPPHAEEVWAELIAHLDDDRYCITYESFSGYTYDFTVGEVCREIIARTLCCGYFESVEWGIKEAYLGMESGNIPRDPGLLKRWCEERRGKKLYEIQIEMCVWASAELAKPGRFRRVSRETANQWVIAVDAAAKSLRKSKMAIPWEGFGLEEITAYRREKAEEIRKKYRQNAQK